jgi:hypothetical protein
MKKLIALVIGLFFIFEGPALAGCIGPVINGVCHGQEVPWDTHPEQEYKEERPAPPGFFWDKRGSKIQWERPEWINPFTGKDAHDSNWFNQEEK